MMHNTEQEHNEMVNVMKPESDNPIDSQNQFLENKTTEQSSGSRVDETTSEQQQDENDDRLSKRLCCFRCLPFFLRYPRFSSFMLGAIIPLWSIVLICAFFGYFLAMAEGPNEITENNAVASTVFVAQNATHRLEKLLGASSILCAELYISEKHKEEEWKLMLEEIVYGYVKDPFADFPNITTNASEQNTVINNADFFNFLLSCSNTLQSTSDNISAKVANSVDNILGDDLTFNWIICAPHPPNARPTNTARRPQAQQDYFISVWESDQQQLYQSFYNSTYNGTNLDYAQAFAYNQSVYLASGESGCYLNMPGSAWFWFTVLSTMGYGNQAPVTVAGRSLVYTFGFISILCFGAILAVSGHVVTAIVDDALVRFNLEFMNRPWIASIMWGALYYAWMVVIAVVTIDWKRRRLGQDFSSRDAYWFAYISSTSVGLGDFYLQPQVFTGADLMLFPFIMLIGFVLLASFLGKFAEFFSSLFRRGRLKQSIVETILGELKTTDMIGDVTTAIDTPRIFGRKNEVDC